MLVGGLLGLMLGGLLVEIALWAPSPSQPCSCRCSRWPTTLRTHEPDVIAPATAPEGRAVRYYVHAAARPGVRGFLVAQILWVLGYAALPAFFLLYAEEELG